MHYLGHIVMGLLLALVISAPLGAAPYSLLRGMISDQPDVRTVGRTACARRWGWHWSTSYKECVRTLAPAATAP